MSNKYIFSIGINFFSIDVDDNNPCYCDIHQMHLGMHLVKADILFIAIFIQILHLALSIILQNMIIIQ